MFGRLTEKILSRLPSRRVPGAVLVAVSARGLLERREGVERLRPWADVASVDAMATDGLASGGQALLIGFADGATLAVGEADSLWRALGEELPRRLPGIEPMPQWMLRLAAAPGAPLHLFSSQ